eukprot:8220720-Ditylum_brightwellii.AAC.1
MEIRSIKTANNCLMPDYDIQAQIEDVPNKSCKRPPRQRRKKEENRTRTAMEKGSTLGSDTKH